MEPYVHVDSIFLVTHLLVAQSVLECFRLTHLLLGLHFIHTSYIVLPASEFLPASKGFISQNTNRGRSVGFSALYNLRKTMCLTSTKW